MSERVRRYDSGTLAPAERLDNGWLRVEGRSARTGILEYDNADGTTRRELVVPEELFAPASLASARMVPVCNKHPDGGLLDANTAKQHQVGSVGENLRADGDYLVAPLMITDAAAIEAINAGSRELSWGYSCAIDPPDPSLVSKYGHHDGIQRGRSYNHLAVVARARAGDGARMRLDTAGNAVLPLCATQQSHAATQQTENPMPQTVRIDGQSFEMADANAAIIQSQIDRVLDKARKDAADALAVEAAKVKHLRANAIQRGNVARKALARIDAMKARMIGCDECGGAKQVDGVKCDYCDGAGMVRMHDAIKAMPPADGEPVDDAMEMDPPDMVEDDSIDKESPAEEKLEQAANPEHKDAARKSRAAAQQKRADSRARILAREVAARVALEVEARKHLGADVKLDGKDALAVKRDVLAKLAPHLDAAKLDAPAVGILYAAEIARAAPRTDGLSASDRARAGSLPAPAARQDGSLETLRREAAEARAAREAANANAWKRPA